MLKQILARLDRSTETYPVLAFVLAQEAKRLKVQASSDGIHKTTVRSMAFGNGMVVNDELWALSGVPISDEGNPEVKIRCVYSADGGYVGEERHARLLLANGIVPELKRSDLSVCSIGYSKRRQSWWGWSHRAMAEFAVGDRIFDPDYGDDSTPFRMHGRVVINNLSEAREAACNFSDYVS